jgi:hypothetical protein
MTRSRILMAFAGAIAALGLFTGEARAVFLVQVTSHLDTPAGGTTTVGGSSVTLLQHIDPSSDIDLSIGSNPVHQTYGTTVVTSTTPSTSPADMFTIPYTWTLTFTHVDILNNPIGASTTLTGIAGTISGALRTGGSTLGNTFTGNPSDTSPVIITVDGRMISVKLDAYTPPGTPPDSKDDFSVSLKAVPEPTTIALMGVGGLVLLAPYLRRKTRMTTV